LIRRRHISCPAVYYGTHSTSDQSVDSFLRSCGHVDECIRSSLPLLSLTNIYFSSYCEALPILYSNNTFTFNSATPLFAFFTSVPLKQLSWIRTLTLAIVLLKDAMNFDSESLYKDPLNLHHYSRLLKLFARLPGNRTVVCLSYRIANKTYMQYPRLGDFALLSKFDEAKKKKMDHVAMFYEIVGALSEDEGRLMFGRWKVGERVDIQ
jgi:hypothetical protein